MNYGSITHRDFDLAKSIVHKIVPHDDLIEFSKLFLNMSDEYDYEGYSTDYLENYRVGFLYNCAVIFAASKTWKDSRTITYARISIMVNLLNYRDSMEIFQRLPKDIQNHFLVMKINNTKEAVNTYLRCIERTGIRNLKYVGNDSSIRTDKVIEYGESASVRRYTSFCAKHILELVSNHSANSHREQKLDLSPIKPHFMTKIFDSGITLNLLKDVRVPILIMWKALYGEKKVLDCINEFESRNIFFNPDQVMDILDEWDDLQNYPLEWIIETRNYAPLDY